MLLNTYVGKPEKLKNIIFLMRKRLKRIDTEGV